jgi:phenylacetate-CoA ligase
MDPIERIPHERLMAEIDWPLLVAQVDRVRQGCPFYSRKLKASDPSTAGLRGWGDFHVLPCTTKSELLEEQERHPPYGRFIGTETPGGIVRVHRTSGTTGRPLFIAMSTADAAATREAGRRAFVCAGLTPADTVVHCLNYCMWAGGVTDHLSLEATGAAVIPFGVGHTSQLVEAIRALRPTSISCTPSYLSRLETVLGQEFSLHPRDLGLRKAFCGGEGGLQNPVVRRHMEDTWGLRVIDANYGLADALSIFGAECDERTGLHFHGQGIVHLELVEPTTGTHVPFREGATGEIVLTNLIREIQPLIRYRTGDVVTVTGLGSCGCGRESLRFSVLGRSDQMVVVRGVNVFPGALKSLLLEESESFSGEFRILLPTPPPHDQVTLVVEGSARGVPGAESRKRLEARLRTRLGFSPAIEYRPLGSFPRTESKTQYVIRSF